MSDKDEAMGSFKRAVNNSSRKKEKKNKEKQPKKEPEIQNQKPTTKEEENNNENEKNLSEEEMQQQELQDRISHDISDDLEDEDLEEEKKSDNSTSHKRKEKKENDTKENANDNDKSNTLNDDKDSATKGKSSSDKNKSSSKEVDNGGKDKGNQNSDSQSTDKYRPNNSAGDTASQGVNGAGEVGGTGAEAGNAAAAADASAGAGAGATAEAAGGTAAAAGTAVAGAPLWLVILIIVAVIFIIITVIGYISFFISGPGLVREKLLKYFNSFWKGVQGFFVGKEDAMVDKASIISIADYLEEMGYDLVDYGFLNTEGQNVTTETDKKGAEITKNARGKTILKREKNSETGKNEITKIQSKYIASYLSAENRTYIVSNQNKNVASVFGNMWDYVTGDETFSGDRWGTGMIYIEGMSEETADNMGISSDAEWGKSKNIKIDRENKKMIITKDGHVYQYDLDGWAGRYGMSIEFLLTLHLATMAPDFVYDVATDEDFDAKVHIALYEVETSVEVVYKLDEGKYAQITDSNYSDYVSYEQWEAIKAYNNDSITTYTPIITKVVNHWFNNLDFAGCYKEVENDPTTTDDDEKFTYYYQYIGLGDESDVLANGANSDKIYIKEVRKKDIYQEKEPKVIDNSKRIKQMLLGSTDEDNSENTNKKYQYYIYDGSPMSKEETERKKDYIIKKVKLEDEEIGYTMNTRMFTYAFAILESVHSEDAEFVLRDLKELFRSVGVKDAELDAEQGSTTGVTPVVWPIKDYKPIVWDPVIDAETSKVTIRHKTDDILGFDKGIDFIMPADGEIIQITRGDKDEKGETKGDSVKIKFTGTDGRNDIKDMYIYVSGIKLNEDVTQHKKYSKSNKIGETIDKDIIIIMTDKQSKSIYNVDQYLQPEEWKFDTANDITESDFGNDVFGNTGGSISPYTGTFSEEFYWYVGVALEGMPINTDMYFTQANKGVEWLPGESYITVGPGLYMHEENCNRFRSNGYSNFNKYSLSSIFPKEVTAKVFKQSIDETYKSKVESYMSGYPLNQKQMEALVMTAYQRGVGGGSTLWKVLDAIKAGKTGTELMNIWTYSTSGLAGVRKRRYAEWYLFTYGTYISPYSGSGGITFNSATPFTDALNGINSVTYS